ncbi:MAG: DnaJ domain-containing protein [Patescibacteria group bacterium]
MAADYYQTLGISKTASADEIKRAYRKLAHQHHPDKTGGNEAKFKEINEAYQVLSDDKKRQQYDAYGSAGPQGFSGGGFQDFGGFSQGFGGINVEDIFDMFGSSFAQGFGGQGVDSRGQDIEVALTITLPEALLGGQKIFEIEKQNICEVCKGAGGSDISTCKVCEGKGQVNQQMSSLFGSFTRRTVCANCHGSGKAPKELCKECKGDGRKRGRERIEFELPSGIEEGATFSIKNKGQAGYRGASAGNLHLRIHINMPRKLSRRARELVEELSLEL